MDNNMKKEIATILKDMKKDVKHYECNEKIIGRPPVMHPRRMAADGLYLG